MLRNLRRRLRIASGRAAVTSPRPWYLRAAALAGWAVAVSALVYWAYSLGHQNRNVQREPTADGAAEESVQLKRENTELRQRLAQTDRQVEIERATYGELAKQVKSLAAENASLQEDLSFFQTLMPPPKAEQTLSVNRFVIEKQLVPGEYRYRLLLLHMAPFGKEFAGSYQLLVELAQNDTKKELAFPASDEVERPDFRLRFKSYQRLDGLFRVPADAQLKRVQIRVFEEGTKNPLLAQTIEVSPDGTLNVHSKK